MTGGPTIPPYVAFAEFCRRRAGVEGDAVFAAAFLTARLLAEGKVCLPLNEVAGRRIDLPGSSISFEIPTAQCWRLRLLASGVVGHPGEFKPLILAAGDRLYLHKYHAYETLINDTIRKRLEPGRLGFLKLDPEVMKAKLAPLFPNEKDGKSVFQKICCLTAAAGSFLAVSGGPGTGKTTVAAKIVSFLAALAPKQPFRVILTAPTGKAAARLRQVWENEGHDGLALEIASPLTIHRLLGAKILQDPVRSRPEVDFPGDVLIVDEASMVDLSLLARLFSILPPRVKIILLGDWRQLGAVEAGSPFADLPWDKAGFFTPDRWGWLVQCLHPPEKERLRPAPGPPIQDCLIELTDNWRFPREGGLGRMIRAVATGQIDEVRQSITNDGQAEITWREWRQPGDLYALLTDYLNRHLVPYFQATRQGAAPGELFHQFQQRAIICALRNGPQGALAVNNLLEKMLSARGFCPRGASVYPGRPVMVTVNDYTLELFNGDTGLTLACDGASGELMVHFPGGDGEFRRFSENLLTSLETNYALTVHKAQGSEYEQVIVILPEADSPVLTRELIYTAISRARTSVHILGGEDVLRLALARPRLSSSGLGDSLWRL